VVGRGRMAGLALVLRARIWERVGVEDVSMTPSPIQYRPCFLPPPTLMTISPSKSWAPIDLYISTGSNQIYIYIFLQLHSHQETNLYAPIDCSIPIHNLEIGLTKQEGNPKDQHDLLSQQNTPVVDKILSSLQHRTNKAN